LWRNEVDSERHHLLGATLMEMEFVRLLQRASRRTRDCRESGKHFDWCRWGQSNIRCIRVASAAKSHSRGPGPRIPTKLSEVQGYPARRRRCQLGVGTKNSKISICGENLYSDPPSNIFAGEPSRPSDTVSTTVTPANFSSDRNCK
jgi:hypothetical protein